MDPNEALTMLRWLAGEVVASGDHEPWAEQFQALDEWLSKGNTLPDEWGRERQTLTHAERAVLDAFHDRVARARAERGE